MASNEATTNGADALGWLCPTHGKINNKDVKNPGIQQALRQVDSSTSHQNESTLEATDSCHVGLSSKPLA